MWAKIKEKFKSLNAKKLIRASVVLFALGMIIFMTIAQIGLTERYEFFTWLSNVLILMGIAVLFLFLGESSGYDKMKDNLNGLYQTTLDKLEKLLVAIDEIKLFFGQWFKWYKPQEEERKKVDFLTTFGVDERKAVRIVKCCTLSDLADLKSCTKEYKALYEDKTFIIRQLEEHEILPVTEVLKGNIRLEASSPGSFLSAFADPNNARLLEVGKKKSQDIKANKKYSRILKLAVSFGIAVVWGFFTVKEFMSGDDVMAWMNLISRLLMALTSYLSGFLSSVVTVKLEADILQNKIIVLTMFKKAYEEKLFPCFDEDELDRRELKKSEEERQKALESVITPDVVTNEPKRIEAQPVIEMGELAK